MAPEADEQPTPDGREAALGLAAATFALAAPCAYVAQRLFEVLRAGAPMDPLLVLREAHTAFYWRVATATWWAGLLAIVVYALVRHRGGVGRLTAALAWAALPLVGVLVVLAWWFP